MYLLISFDFCGSSDVKIHAFLEELSCAKKLFDKVKQNNINVKNFQLQLLKLPNKFQSENGVTLFWTDKYNDILSIANLNTDKDSTNKYKC